MDEKGTTLYNTGNKKFSSKESLQKDKVIFF